MLSTRNDVDDDFHICKCILSVYLQNNCMKVCFSLEFDPAYIKHKHKLLNLNFMCNYMTWYKWKWVMRKKRAILWSKDEN